MYVLLGYFQSKIVFMCVILDAKQGQFGNTYFSALNYSTLSGLRIYDASLQSVNPVP